MVGVLSVMIAYIHNKPYSYPFHNPQYSPSLTLPHAHCQMSFDFVDLDEESFFDLKHYNNFPKFPEVSPLLTPTPLLEEASIFLRSTSPINSKPEDTDKDKVELVLPIGTLRFNPKGPNHEGRDSQVFYGELVTNTNELVSLEVAVKVYKGDQTALEGAKKEVQIAQTITKNRPDFLKLFYSGSVKIISISSHEQPEFISVWEWIEGGTIDRLIPKLSDSQIRKVIKSLAKSIGHLHSCDLAHHDLKPQNILITSNLERTIVIDFGDSKQLKRICCCNTSSKSDSGDTSNTLVNFNNTTTTNCNCCCLPLDEGIGLGTLAYTAPELLSRKSQFYDPFAADVYSFGVLLFYFLNKGTILPFQALVPHRAVQLILTVQKGFFAGGYNPEKPRDSPIYPLMLKCLQVDPLKRPKFPEIIETINFAFIE